MPTATKVMDITEIDPRKAIGPRTSVLRLFKVEDGLTIHFCYAETKHGLYCSSHGRECRAVKHVERYIQEKK